MEWPLVSSLAASKTSERRKGGFKEQQNYSETTDRVQQSVTNPLMPQFSQSLWQDNSITVVDDSSSTPARPDSGNSPSSTFQPRSFDPKASLVLIGSRGVGKSTLATIAATALCRKAIEVDGWFIKVTGTDRTTHRSQNGIAKHRSKEIEVMQEILTSYDKNHVIVCGHASLQNRGRAMLKKYAQSHPVVLINRSIEAIQKRLPTSDLEEIKTLLAKNMPSYRAMSNFEYYNWCEESFQSLDLHETHSRQFMSNGRSGIDGGFQRIGHNVGHDFCLFLNRIFGSIILPIDQETLIPSLPEQRQCSNVLVLPLEKIITGVFDLTIAEGGTDVIELLVDADAGKGIQARHELLNTLIPKAFAMIRRNTKTPIMYTVTNSASDCRGFAEANQAICFELINVGLRLGSQYMSLNLSCAEATITSVLRSKGATKVVAQLDSFGEPRADWSRPELFDEYERAKSLGFDVFRISQNVFSIDGSISCLKFGRHVRELPGPQIPVVIHSSGQLSLLSASFNHVLTPVTYPSVDLDLDCPLMTARQLRQLQHFNDTIDKLKFCGYGASDDYVLLQAIYKAAFEDCGLLHTYDINERTTLHDLSAIAHQPDFGGASTSFSVKSETLAMLDYLSASARFIGEVNTILPVRDLPGISKFLDPRDKSLRNRAGSVKALYGDNTDWIGIFNCVLRSLPLASPINSRSTVLILGAGSIAHASIYALAQLGLREIFIYNRTLSHAITLASEYKDKPVPIGNSTRHVTIHTIPSLTSPWPHNFLPPTIIVCLDPRAQSPQSSASSSSKNLLSSPPQTPNSIHDFLVPTAWLHSPIGGVLIDLSHKPYPSPSRTETSSSIYSNYTTFSGTHASLEPHYYYRSRGWTVIDSLQIQLEKSYAQFELFTGLRAPREVMRRVAVERVMCTDGPVR